MLSFFQQVGGFNGQCEMYLKKFEDPKQNDPMSRMQNDLDETKIVLVRTLFKMNKYLFALHISNPNSSPAQYNRGSARKRRKAWRLGRQEWGPVHAVQGFLQDSEENKFLLWNKLGLNFLVTGACIHFTGSLVPNALNVPGIFLYTWKIMVNGWFLGWKLEDLC